ncbi:hypothetical protein CDAR_207321 [Caerostris darwini]|uniref:Uncharacterized protein n=1 Tax=Caerostris darwini TaxID=1538125 RepID=A0AAV4VHC6_9ARAC|nr:hypothetical protein CDAR_207321 [Caerostris darwini]
MHRWNRWIDILIHKCYPLIVITLFIRPWVLSISTNQCFPAESLETVTEITDPSVMLPLQSFISLYEHSKRFSSVSFGVESFVWLACHATAHAMIVMLYMSLN